LRWASPASLAIVFVLYFLVSTNLPSTFLPPNLVLTSADLACNQGEHRLLRCRPAGGYPIWRHARCRSLFREWFIFYLLLPAPIKHQLIIPTFLSFLLTCRSLLPFGSTFPLQPLPNPLSVFGKVAGGTVLPILVASSAFGNLIAVAIGQSRVIREVARQGVLPFSDFFTSTRPLGTPIGPILLKWSLTVLVILALPLGDAFVFVGKSLDLHSLSKLRQVVEAESVELALDSRSRFLSDPALCPPQRRWCLAYP
jgi:amino acid transporter